MSIRRAAATSEAKLRRSEQRCFSYFKLSLLAIILLMLWDECAYEFQQPERTSTGTTTETITYHPNNNNNNNDGVKSTTGSRHQTSFRLYRYWKKMDTANSILYDSSTTGTDQQQNYTSASRDDDDDDKNRQILVVLKNLDEAIQGNIVLRSNKAKYQDAVRGWQRQYCAFSNEEESTSSSSSSLFQQPNLPPLAVVEAATLEDVQLAVPILAGLERDYGLDFRVRSGGHAYMNGYSTISNGVVLSLGKLNSIAVDSLVPVLVKHDNDNNNNNSNNNNDNNKEEFDYTMGNNKNDLDVNGTNGIIITETVNNETATTSRSRSSTTGAKTVVMGPGVRTEEFMKNVLDANGYSGIVASAAGVAMGGYVSGGGYGLQSRMYGLAIDNVVSLQVVLASGEIKKVRDGDDLFWALRGGGGGNIGVVTSIEYRVYPSRDIKLAATVKVSLAEMTQFLQRLGEKEPDLAPEFTLNVHVYSSRVSDSNDTIQIPNLSPHMANAYMYSEQTSGTTKDPNNVNEEDNRLVTLSMFWMGDTNPDDPVGMEYIKKEIMPLFSSNNSNNTDGDDVIYYYFSWSGMSREREQRPEFKSVWSAQSWNGFLLPGNNTEEVWTDIQSSLSAMFRYCKYVSPRVELWGGAISKIPFNATAFPYREAVYNVGIDLLVPAESDAEVASDEMHLVNAVWPSIARHLDGVYVNYPMASLSSESYPTAYWGNNLDRLVALKEQYDPSHAFQTAQSIPIPGNDS